MFSLPLALTLLLSLHSPAPARTDGQPVEFVTDDGITVSGDLYRAGAPDGAPVILLFHQGGGDARGEYGPLVSRLLEAGYHALAIDQRRGGSRFGGTNRTVERLAGREFSYCEAMPDLEGAVREARRQGLTGPLVLWGSSYSATLAIRLAAKLGSEIAAVLAFSPAGGGPMQSCPPDEAAAQLESPLLVLRPVREMEIPSARAQMELFRSLGHQTQVADPGVHGSSMLNPERVDGSAEPTWKVVLEFLASRVGRSQ